MSSEIPDIPELKRAVESGQRIDPEDVCFGAERERIDRWWADQRWSSRCVHRSRHCGIVLTQVHSDGTKPCNEADEFR